VLFRLANGKLGLVVFTWSDRHSETVRKLCGKRAKKSCFVF
jgi:hypothetical protein